MLYALITVLLQTFNWKQFLAHIDEIHRSEWLEEMFH